jgi:hypothetical protein
MPGNGQISASMVHPRSLPSKRTEALVYFHHRSGVTVDIGIQKPKRLSMGKGLKLGRIAPMQKFRHNRIVFGRRKHQRSPDTMRVRMRVIGISNPLLVI